MVKQNRDGEGGLRTDTYSRCIAPAGPTPLWSRLDAADNEIFFAAEKRLQLRENTERENEY